MKLKVRKCPKCGSDAFNYEEYKAQREVWIGHDGIITEEPSPGIDCVMAFCVSSICRNKWQLRGVKNIADLEVKDGTKG